MSCDVCHLRLPLSNYLANKSVEAQIGNDSERVKITGSMPKDAVASMSKLNNDEALNLARKFKSDITAEDISYAYDISLNSKDFEYQPSDFNKSVKVKLSNLDLDSSKTYALLHVIDENNYEILPYDAMTSNGIEFTARSFSVYIVITVETRTVTFDGENYTVLDAEGNEIKNDAIIAEGTDFTFTIMPKDGYGVSSATCTLGANAMEIAGGVRSKTCNIAEVSENATIYVTTVAIPEITAHPTSVKVEEGNNAVFTITANNATTYEWQYREGEDYGWKSASTVGEGYDSNTFSAYTDEEYTDFEYRCLVGNTYFTENDRVISDVVRFFTAPGEISREVVYLDITITKQPESQKVVVGETAVFTIEVTGTNTFQWQYKASGDEVWKNVDDTIGEDYTTNTLLVDTSSMSIDDDLNYVDSMSGMMFRCRVGESYALVSDVAYLSVAQGDEDIEVSTRKDISTLNISIPNEERVYKASAYKPVVTVVDESTLTVDTDYTVDWGENINAGKGTVTVEGINKYYGTKTIEFDIAKRALEITAGSDSKKFDGSPLVFDKYEVKGEVAEPDVLTVTVTGTITDVGTAPNKISGYTITRDSVNVADNYDVTLKDGTLEIFASVIGGSVSISGVNRVYQALYADVSTDITVASTTYQWYYNDVADKDSAKVISGATDKVFVITEDLLGRYIFVGATVTAEGYEDTTFMCMTSANENGSEMTLKALKSILKAEVSSNVANDVIFSNSTISVKRSQIVEIEIQNNMIKPDGAVHEFDISRDGDTNVMAWIVPSGGAYKLYIGGYGKTVVTDGAYLFANYTNCTSIEGLENLDFGMVSNMSNMFEGCAKLSAVDVSSMDTIRTKNMKAMFNGCSALTTLDVSGFDTVNVTDMSGMFNNCSGLTTLNVSLLDTSRVTNMASMFAGCSKLSALDVRGFVTEKVKSVGKMFAGCSALERLDLSNFNLKAIDSTTYFDEVDGVKDTGLTAMFNGCGSLKSMVLGRNFGRINGANMFSGCGSLVAIISQSATPMTLSTDTGVPAGVVLYVPTAAGESAYEGASNYAGVFGPDRVKRMIEVLGDNPVNLKVGDTYVEAGAKVAGFGVSDASEYESYGYTLDIKPTSVSTARPGTTKVIYTLKYFDKTIDTVQY